MHLLRGLGELVETMVFDVAVFRHIPDEAITFRPPAWLFDQHERVARVHWETQMRAVQAAEAGTLRALARAFSKSTVPDLQNYDEMLRESRGPGDIPGWMEHFEEANRKPDH